MALGWGKQEGLDVSAGHTALLNIEHPFISIRPKGLTAGRGESTWLTRRDNASHPLCLLDCVPGAWSRPAVTQWEGTSLCGMHTAWIPCQTLQD